MHYEQWEWRRMTKQGGKCAKWKCANEATWLLTWRTSAMPACAFNLYCDKHKAECKQH